MRQIFTIKRGDTSPAILYELPSDVDLTGASVLFKMKDASDVVITNAAATIVSATAPAQVSYEWAALDTATAGPFDAEFEVTYADTSIETFPNQGFIRIAINQDV